MKSLFIETYSTPNYFTEDGIHIVLTTINDSKKSLILLNVITKKLQLIDFDLDAVEILALKSDLLIIAASTPKQPPMVFAGILDVNNLKSIKFKKLLHTKNLSKNDKLNYRIIKQNDDKPLDKIQTIVIGLSDKFDLPSPSIVIPHGGKMSLSNFYFKIIFNYFILL